MTTPWSSPAPHMPSHSPETGSGLPVSLHRPRLQKTPRPQSQQLPSHAHRPLKPAAPPVGVLDWPATLAPFPSRDDADVPPAATPQHPQISLEAHYTPSETARMRPTAAPRTPVVPGRRSPPNGYSLPLRPISLSRHPYSRPGTGPPHPLSSSTTFGCLRPTPAHSPAIPSDALRPAVGFAETARQRQVRPGGARLMSARPRQRDPGVVEPCVPSRPLTPRTA